MKHLFFPAVRHCVAIVFFIEERYGIIVYSRFYCLGANECYTEDSVTSQKESWKGRENLAHL